MKLLRFFVVAAVLAYAGWLAWPWIAPLLGMAPPAGGEAMRSSAEAGAPLFGVVPPWALLAAAVGLYVVAALMLGSGNSKAAVAYFLGFIADAALRLAIDGRAPAEIFTAPETTAASAARGVGSARRCAHCAAASARPWRCRRWRTRPGAGTSSPDSPRSAARCWRGASRRGGGHSETRSATATATATASESLLLFSHTV